MKYDFSLTITSIIAFCALISPIITAIINNLYNLKIKKIDLKNKHHEETTVYKRTILRNYISSIGKCISYCQAADMKEYGKYFPIALALVDDEEISNMMITLNALILDHKWTDSNKLVIKLIPKLKSELYNQ